MASENPQVVVAPTVENGNAESSSRGKEEEPLESEISKKLQVTTEGGKEENEEEEEEEDGEGSKGLSS